MTTTLDQRDADGVTVLRVLGPLTEQGVEAVSAAFEAATQRGRVLVDLGDVRMMTTPGIAMLLKAYGRLDGTGGRLVLTGVEGVVDELLRLCKLDRVLTFVDDRDEAMRRARG